jgi:chaperonin GroES
MGEVVAVGELIKTSEGPRFLGPDGRLLPVLVKVGDKVLTKKWGGDEAKVGGVEYMLVKQAEILAVME